MYFYFISQKYYILTFILKEQNLVAAAPTTPKLGISGILRTRDAKGTGFCMDSEIIFLAG